MANTITGMAKVLYKNFMVSYPNTITAPNGQAATANINDNDKYTKWITSGSDDTITETITVLFTDILSINCLALLNMNWKEFQVFYLTGGVWTEFTNVYSNMNYVIGSKYGTGIYGASTYGMPTKMNYVDNTLDTMYFEFDTVSTTSIKIEVTRSIIANAQKYLYELYVGKLIGTFIEDISSSPNNMDVIAKYTKSVYLEKSNAGTIKLEKTDKYRAKISIKELLETTDQTLIDDMEIAGEFVFYPCGGNSDYVRNGWRYKDLYNVIYIGDISGNHAVGRVKDMGYNYEFELNET